MRRGLTTVGVLGAGTALVFGVALLALRVPQAESFTWGGRPAVVVVDAQPAPAGAPAVWDDTWPKLGTPAAAGPPAEFARPQGPMQPGAPIPGPGALSRDDTIGVEP